MDALLENLVAVAVGGYVVYAVLAIVMVHHKTRWLDPARISTVSVDALYDEVPALRDGVARLAPLGFLPVSGARIDHPPAEPRMIILRREGEPAVASVTAYRSRLRHVIVTEFGQLEADGRCTAVNDASMTLAPPALGCARLLRFPKAAAPQLWQSFQRIRAAEAKQRPWRAWPDVDDVENLRRESERQVRELFARGSLASDARDGPPALSWRGAMVMTLKLIWPWRLAVDRAQVAHARRVAAGVP